MRFFFPRWGRQSGAQKWWRPRGARRPRPSRAALGAPASVSSACSWISLAGAEGLEPPTFGFGDRCSTKLSYAPRLRSPRYVGDFGVLSIGTGPRLGKGGAGRRPHVHLSWPGACSGPIPDLCFARRIAPAPDREASSWIPIPRTRRKVPAAPGVDCSPVVPTLPRPVPGPARTTALDLAIAERIDEGLRAIEEHAAALMREIAHGDVACLRRRGHRLPTGTHPDFISRDQAIGEPDRGERRLVPSAGPANGTARGVSLAELAEKRPLGPGSAIQLSGEFGPRD